MGWELQSGNYRCAMQSELAEAIINDDADAIQQLADKKVDINDELVCYHGRGYTPLGYAAVMGSLNAGKALLDNKANSEKYNSSNKLPLHLAVQEDKYFFVKMLLQEGARIESVSDGFTILNTFMATSQHVEMAKLLCTYLSRLNNQSRFYKFAAFKAARRKNLEILKIFIEFNPKLELGYGEDGLSINDALFKARWYHDDQNRTLKCFKMLDDNNLIKFSDRDVEKALFAPWSNKNRISIVKFLIIESKLVPENYSDAPERLFNLISEQCEFEDYHTLMEIGSCIQEKYKPQNTIEKMSKSQMANSNPKP